jgi:hypothetical protein
MVWPFVVRLGSGANGLDARKGIVWRSDLGYRYLALAHRPGGIERMLSGFIDCALQCTDFCIAIGYLP